MSVLQQRRHCKLVRHPDVFVHRLFNQSNPDPVQTDAAGDGQKKRKTLSLVAKPRNDGHG